MNEIILLKVGIWIGYAITSACLVLFFYFIMCYKIRKLEMYLYKTGQLQKFEEWKQKNKKIITIGGK